MICIQCGKEHLHDPGQFLIVNVFRSTLFPKMLVACAEKDGDPDCILDSAVHGSTNKEIEEKIHAQYPNESLHWHWPGDVEREIT